MNLFVDDPTFTKLNTMHFYIWSSGLKTGMYYLRRKPKHQTQQFTIAPTNNTNNDDNNIIDDNEICEMCSS